MKSLLVALVPLSLVACQGLGPSSPEASASGGSASSRDAGDGLRVAVQTTTLPNGLTVTLHEDHSLPKVVINTWFAVGSKDEASGRTGFAHLFEHLMFMGTGRVPDNQFDVLMERGGGNNNATTSNDRTNYFSLGPSSLLPTLLWLDADRLDALDAHMTQEKLDKQRAVVRNERRQNTENVPYGKGSLIVPEALYPEGHPYHHPVIGSHEDLEAATVDDVVEFFRTYYVPSNASLVIAGDFDPDEVMEVVTRTFGAIPAKPAPARISAPAWHELVPDQEQRIVTTDQVQFGKLTLAWHAPAYYAEGDGEMDLIASILAGGPSSRLESRLVEELGLAQSVSAYQLSRELGSTFLIEAIASPGQSLESIKLAVLEELATFRTDGPTAAELQRAQVRVESSFLNDMESLLSRADSINAYRHYFGVSDGFQRDLDRYLDATPESLRQWAERVFVPGRLDLRILPEAGLVDASALDERPADFEQPDFTPAVAERRTLSNGIDVVAIERPGTRLFSGSLLCAGGDALFPAERAGLAPLTASLLEAGAGSLDKGAFADAVDSIGASMGAGAGTRSTTLSVSGLTSRFDETLDLFADMALRPELASESFELERTLTLAGIQARADNPNAVAGTVMNALFYGADDPRGRPSTGTVETVGALTVEDVRAAKDALLSPDRSTFAFAGDFGPGGLDDLVDALERRFGSWSTSETRVPTHLPVIEEPAPGRIVLVDRPGAPQTVVRVLRPVLAAASPTREARACVDTVFGGSFTSRLNANLREDKGYTYGAGSRIQRSGEQWLMLAYSSVRTDVTGASLEEFQREFARMRADGIDEGELSKAVETLRGRVVGQAETTGGQAGSLAALVQNELPLDDAHRTLEALAGVSLADVNALAKSELYDWDQLLIVLVGDAEAVVPQLEAAGFGAPVRVDADGKEL